MFIFLREKIPLVSSKIKVTNHICMHNLNFKLFVK